MRDLAWRLSRKREHELQGHTVASGGVKTSEWMPRFLVWVDWPDNTTGLYWAANINLHLRPRACFAPFHVDAWEDSDGRHVILETSVGPIDMLQFYVLGRGVKYVPSDRADYYRQ